MKRELTLRHGQIALPAFLPDGTQGVVRSVDAHDLAGCNIQAVQMNVFHLMQRPGSSTIQALGGLHRLSGWQGPIFTDSGGFQVYSLLRQDAKQGAISDKGASFKLSGSNRKYNLTPEKSVQLQLSYGADMVICLDDCTHAEDDLTVQAASVRRTVAWAKRCRREFDRLCAEKGLAEAERPLLMAVIQGGVSHELRQQCAEALLAIGFDAYGYGGWPLDGQNQLLAETLAYVRQLVPSQFPVHALGVGHPPHILRCTTFGYNLFDSTMPTRDARHGRLYTFAIDPETEPLTGDWFAYKYIKDKKHIKANQPISPACGCLCCKHYSLGYLYHLFKLNDSLYPRLATMHNLYFMTQLMATIRRHGGEHG